MKGSAFVYGKVSWNDMVDDMDDYDTYNTVIPMIYDIINEKTTNKNIVYDKDIINKYSSREEWLNL